MEYVIETRITYDHGGRLGMHCRHPTGLYTRAQSYEKIQIDMGQFPIYLEIDFQPGWALITDCQGAPMIKIRMPLTVEPDYEVHRFYNYGKLYILEIRIDKIIE